MLRLNQNCSIGTLASVHWLLMVPFYSSSVSMERFNNKHNNYNLHSVVLKRVELWQGFLPRIIRDEGL
jgi:hypothetical protein